MEGLIFEKNDSQDRDSLLQKKPIKTCRGLDIYGSILGKEKIEGCPGLVDYVMI